MGVVNFNNGFLTGVGISTGMLNGAKVGSIDARGPAITDLALSPSGSSVLNNLTSMRSHPLSSMQEHGIFCMAGKKKEKPVELDIATIVIESDLVNASQDGRLKTEFILPHLIMENGGGMGTGQSNEFWGRNHSKTFVDPIVEMIPQIIRVGMVSPNGRLDEEQIRNVIRSFSFSKSEYGDPQKWLSDRAPQLKLLLFDKFEELIAELRRAARMQDVEFLLRYFSDLRVSVTRKMAAPEEGKAAAKPERPAKPAPLIIPASMQGSPVTPQQIQAAIRDQGRLAADFAVSVIAPLLVELFIASVGSELPSIVGRVEDVLTKIAKSSREKLARGEDPVLTVKEIKDLISKTEGNSTRGVIIKQIAPQIQEWLYYKLPAIAVELARTGLFYHSMTVALFAESILGDRSPDARFENIMVSIFTALRNEGRAVEAMVYGSLLSVRRG